MPEIDFFNVSSTRQYVDTKNARIFSTTCSATAPVSYPAFIEEPPQ